MDEIVFAILISAAGSFLATLIWTYRSVLSDTLRGRSRNVAGLWSGIAIYGPEPIHKRTFTCCIKQIGSFVYGNLTSSGERVADYTVRGSVMETEYLHVTVRNSDPNVINYATGMLQIDHSCKHMNGDFVGRSRTLDRIVTGKIVMKKS